MKTALVIGALGQDGFYLTQLLLERGYRVIGTTHRQPDNGAIPNYAGELQTMDLRDDASIEAVITRHHPDEIYNLGARASSAQLFDDAVATGDINGLAVTRLLDVVERLHPTAKVCQALSSEVFAGTTETPQSERTATAPVNAYGAAKVYAWNSVRAYRLQKGVFACGAILYNHESPRRGTHFVTRKIALAAATAALGKLDTPLQLGAGHHRRDWGHARDHVRALHAMLQSTSADDYVVATGVTHAVADFAEAAFRSVGLDYRDHVVFADSPDRRTEAVELRGDPRKAQQILKWQPEVLFPELVTEMVQSDLARLRAATHSG